MAAVELRVDTEETIHKSSKRKSPGFLHEVLETRRLLSTVSWNVGASGLWSTAANWSGGAVPAAGDDVVINHSGNVQVTLDGSASVKSLTVTSDTLVISSGSLSVSTTVSNSGSVTINPLASLTVAGAYTESSTGQLTLPQGTFGSGVGTNLLGNPGFENPAAPGNTTTGPDVWGQWGSSYISTVVAHTGTQSLLQYGSNSGLYQSFAVSPGVSYSASVYALDPASGGLTGSQGAFVNLSFSDANGNSISSPSQFLTALNSQSATGIWINTTTTITAPAGAASINLDLQVGAYTGISGTAGGAIYWDDIQLGPTAINAATLTAASVSNSGTISLGAGDTLNTTGTFTQAASGILNAQLGGPSAGNYFGSVNAGGKATLAGTLKASIVNSYSPSLNNGFSLLNYNGGAGSFSTYQLPSGSTYIFQPGVNPTYVGISAVPPSISTTINAAVTTATATTNLIGVNLALWDGYLNTTQTQQMVQAAGLSLLRFPGGSGSDDYHFNVQDNYGYSSNTVPQFAQFISSVGATGMVTVDYGSGSPQEAEAELAYLEGSPTDTTNIGTGIEWNDATGAWQNVNWQNVGYWASLRAAKPLATDDGLNFMRLNHSAPFTNIKYWEMGNETYYSWETDHHGTPGPDGVSTGAQHDAATYAAFSAAFSIFDAADPSLPQVSTGIGNASPVGSNDNNLMKTVLTDMYNDGAIPGFLSDHVYAQNQGSENDSVLLNGTVSDPASLDDWSTRYADFEGILQQVLGAKASSVQLMATEFNSNPGTPGKQMTSLVNGLYIADSIGSLLNSGYTGGLVWDLRNGWSTTGNNSSTLYGWRQGGDEGLLGSYNYVPAPATGPYVAYPNYFAEQLASKIIQNGGADVSTSSSYSEMTVYSVMEPNGHLELMVLNKNPDAAITEQFNLSGFTPSGSAKLWQYGETQDYAQSQTTDGSAALANSALSLSLTGNNFSYTFPAYSMSVIDLTPKLSVATAAAATASPSAPTTVTLGVAGLENGSDTGLTYTWSATGPSSATYAGATNGTNAAKNITAVFSQAGLYTFSVTIADPGGQTVNSSVQILLPVFASQAGSTLTINLNNLAPINVSASGSTITVAENGSQIFFSGVSLIAVNGSATGNVLNFNGPVTTPFVFSNGATTTVNINSGTLTIAGSTSSAINAQLFSAINLSAGAELILSPAGSGNGRTLLNTQSLVIAGTIGNWTGKLDLNANDLEVQSGNLATIDDQLKPGVAGGIISSTAASNTTHLTTLGAILNTIDGTPAAAALYGGSNPFDGSTPPSTAVLIKYTYYGDANLDGKVDGSDYSRIDNGSLNKMTGWFNGDFNDDGIVNGSDYTLIDNAFNTQGAIISATLASASSDLKSKLAASADTDIVTGSLFAPPEEPFGQSPGTSFSTMSWIEKLLDTSTVNFK